MKISFSFLKGKIQHFFQTSCIYLDSSFLLNTLFKNKHMSATYFSKPDKLLRSPSVISPTACLLFSLTSSAPAILHCSFCLELQMFSLVSTSFFFVLQMFPRFTLSVWETPSKSSFRDQQRTTPPSLSSHPYPPDSSCLGK